MTTWTQAVASYWLARRRDFSPHTVQDYTNTFGRFAQHIGDCPVRTIVSRDIHAFLNEMEQRHGLSRKTLSNYWAALSSFWTWAEMELELPHIIRGRVSRPKYRRKTIRPYVNGEIKLMLDACEEMRPWRTRSGKLVSPKRAGALRDRAIILTLVDTGVRCSELCALQVRDYGCHDRRLFIRHGKGDKERMVYFGDVTAGAIRRYFADRGRVQPSEPLFASRSGGSLKRFALRQLIMRLGERAGVLSANVHRFRHTFAISFLRNGGNILALQDLLGHETLETIRLYVRLAQTDLQAMHRTASPADNWQL